jgi:hypothetical protein
MAIRGDASKGQKEDERGAKSQVGGYRTGAVEESEGAGQESTLKLGSRTASQRWCFEQPTTRFSMPD